ncbi:amino acid transporter [Lentinula raphanica]|uniref:Amino acid transporter n=1 Tax=Lentinula raphanica TaxID=153919 RepID=A0AA38PN01_9AGAR|nr:amino acid transporter [Lentinula raphanica]KAJ3845481.1 amino acid transporter [Lentinula raphanica]
MFSSNKSRDRTAPDNAENGEASQPLLGDHDVVFSIDDDDDEEPLASSSSSKHGHSVRFQEAVQVIGPPLRSTTASREAEFELDSDELDNDTEEASRTPRAHTGNNVPLIVGLLDSSRQSFDSPLPLRDSNGIDLDLEAIAAKRTAGGGLFDSIANMANSILGAGIIGLPYAISQAGFFVGLVLLVVLCGVTDWTIRLIVVNAKLSGSHTYIDIMNHCFGSSGRAAVSFFQFSFAFGGMCAFGIIIGDTIPHVIRSIFPTLYKIPVLGLLTNRQFIIFLCTTCVSYPLSLYRDIHKLSRASGLALISMIIIVASVLVEGPQVPAILKGDPSLRFSFVNAGIFQAIGVISFAFVCHHNSLLIYGSLKTPTLDRFAQVTHVSTLISLVSCCTLAISGYVVFTDKTQGNILNNFPSNNTMINVARFCFGLNMFTTLPLELFVCREVIEDYFFAHEEFNPQRHLFFTTTILFSSMTLAMITCDLGVMLEITGGVSATALAFIFPAACYLKLSNQSLPWYNRKRLPAFICVVFGVTVMTLSLFLALRKSWTKEGEAKMCM